MAGLFRDEVLQERRTQFLGTIRIGRNPSFTLVTVVALLLAGALVAYAAWGEITRKARLAGVLIPVEGTLKAHLYAPSRTVGFVRPGQPVWVRYAAYPHQKFGMARGEIESVGHTPLSARDLPAGQEQVLLSVAQSNEPLYRITVALAKQAIDAHGRAQPLQPGMTLEADVVQERRRIWEWLLEPVLAASGLAPSPAVSAR